MMNLKNQFNQLKLIFKPTQQRSNKDHSSVRAADPYSYQINHIWLTRILRVSVMTNMVQLIVILIVASSFQAILPLKEIRVALLRADPADNRIYRVEPISPKVDGFKVLLEATAREFTQKILTINLVTQREWIARAMMLSSPQFQKYFKENFLENKAIQKIIDEGIKREIQIVSADHVNSLNPGIWKLAVDFDQIDIKDGKEIDRRQLRAYLAITTSIEEVQESQKYDNPLGLKVLEMTIQNRGLKQ